MTTQEKAAIEICKAVAEAIRDLSAASPLGSVPSGELYAHLMGRMSLASYQSIIDTLVGAKLITNHSHLLMWIGPKS